MTAAKKSVRLSKCNMSDLEVAEVERVVRGEFLGMGPEVRAFERELAEFIGGDRHVVCVATGTAALHLALQAAGVGPGDEVLVPTLTYLASFQAISATGARAVACDVDGETGFIDVEDAARRVTSHTKAVMPVHYASGVGDLDAVYHLADLHGLRVIEDAAHAFGCRRNGHRIGAVGDVLCFSFDGVKNITSGEGGAIVTADAALARRVSDLRLLAVRDDSDKRYHGARTWDLQVFEQGWRYHMSDIFAAIGRVQLRRFETDFAPRRVAAAQRYRNLLKDIPGLSMMPYEYGPIVPHIFPVIIADGRRDAVRAALLDEGVGVGLHYKPNHLVEFYRDGLSRPVAERLYASMLTLPLHVDLAEADQQRTAQVIEDVLNACPAESEG